MKTLFDKHNLLKLLLIVLSGLILYIFASNDAFLYKQPVGKVENVSVKSISKTKDTFNNQDKVTVQEVTFKILNGKYRNKIVKLRNTYSQSGGLDQEYKVGNQVFLTIKKHHGKLNSSISHYKRDVYLVMLLWLVIVLLYATMKLNGLKTLLSVAVHFVVFLIFVQLDVMLNLTNFFWLFAAAAFIFTILSLWLVIGFNKQWFVTCASVVSGTVIALLIGLIAMNVTNGKGVHYEALDYATQSPKQLFLAATVIGLLGTVMDAATDIVSTLFEMKRTDEKISERQLFKSGMAVGRSIMGPLINVLLMIFFAETFTMAILYFKTGNSIAYTFEWTMALGIVQTLVSGIGVTLVIPCASFLSAKVLGGAQDVND